VCYSRDSSPLKANSYDLVALSVVETLFKHGYSYQARAYLVPNNKKTASRDFSPLRRVTSEILYKSEFEIPFSRPSQFGGSGCNATKRLKLTYFTSRDSESVKQKCNVELSSAK